MAMPELRHPDASREVGATYPERHYRKQQKRGEEGDQIPQRNRTRTLYLGSKHIIFSFNYLKTFAVIGPSKQNN
jgi:hypothetical protein